MLIILASTGSGIAYSLLSVPWYRAQVVALPVQPAGGSGLGGQLSQLGGLAGLVGISVGGSDKEEPLAVLQSRQFARDFIERERLTTVLLADKWDESSGRWKPTWGGVPDIRDAIDLFERKVLRIEEDRKTSLVTVTVEWTDALQAADWANKYVAQVNEQLRSNAAGDAERSITFLRGELEKTNQVGLAQSIGRVMESELEKLTMAKGREEFAYRIVDRAQVPKKPFKPMRKLLVMGSFLLGALASLVALLLLDAAPGNEVKGPVTAQ